MKDEAKVVCSRLLFTYVCIYMDNVSVIYIINPRMIQYAWYWDQWILQGLKTWCVPWSPLSMLLSWYLITLVKTQLVFICHYNDVIMTKMASQITSLMVVYSSVYTCADQRKYQSSPSLAFVGGIHRTGEFPAQMASNAENVSVWWRHHVVSINKVYGIPIL